MRRDQKIRRESLRFARPFSAPAMRISLESLRGKQPDLLLQSPLHCHTHRLKKSVYKTLGEVRMGPQFDIYDRDNHQPATFAGLIQKLRGPACSGFTAPDR